MKVVFYGSWQAAKLKMRTIFFNTIFNRKSEFETMNSGIEVFLTATYRSKEEENDHYNQPWDKKDNNGNGKIEEDTEKVTKVKGSQSSHNYLPSMAIDVAFRVNGVGTWDTKWFKKFSVFMINPGITWGSTFKSMVDYPHYEVEDWKKLVGN